MSEAALAASLESNYSGGFLYNYAHTINESTSLAADWSSWFNQNGPTCSNETALFGQRAHFISCSVYPYISHEISQGNFISSANLSVDLVNNITLAQNITGTISACLQGFCETVSSCEHITECSPTLLMVNNTLLSTEAISLCWTELCSHQSSTVNPDISGAGVRAFIPFCIYWNCRIDTLLGYDLLPYAERPGNICCTLALWLLSI